MSSSYNKYLIKIDARLDVVVNKQQQIYQNNNEPDCVCDTVKC